jgi:glycosyltransferase involved in cell wall biosynthesis
MLYVSVYDPHISLTGGTVRGRQFIERLSPKFDIDLVYMEGSGQAFDLSTEPAWSSRCAAVANKRAVPFSKWGYFLFSSPMMEAVEELAARRRHDLIVCDYGLSAQYGRRVSRRTGAPLVYLSHNLEYLLYLNKGRRDPRRWALLPHVYRVERWAVRHADLVVSIAPNEVPVYTRWRGRDDVLVIPQGFDEQQFSPNYDPPRNERKVVFFCGNYLAPGNRDVVATVYDRIAARVIEKHPDVLFRFVGAHPPTHLAHPNFEFTGFVPDYLDHLRQADVMISPMLSGAGFPTKIVEALSCGKPTIATDIGARNVWRGHPSLRICDIDRFPAAICEVLAEDRPVRAEGYEELRLRYAWQPMIDRLSGRMMELIQGARG